MKPLFFVVMRTKRKEMKVSLDTIAKHVDCSITTITHIENDVREVKLWQAIKIAEVLKIDLNSVTA